MTILSTTRPARTAEAHPLVVAMEPGFDFRSEQYRALYQRSQATAFQEPEWLDRLHRVVAPVFAAEPATLTIRTPEGRLVLVLPLVRRRQAAIWFLELADFGLCDYGAAVCDPSDTPLLLSDPALPDRVLQLLPSCDVISLTKLAGDDPVLAFLFPRARRARMRVCAYPVRLNADWPQWRTARIEASFRRYLDMKRRRTHRTGTARFALLREEPDILSALAALRRYRVARFRQLGARDPIDDEAVFAFYRQMAVSGAQTGTTRTYCLYLADEPVAVLFGLAARRSFLLLLVGFDLERYRRLSTGLLAIEDSLRHCLEAGDATYDFTIGNHSYKLQFGAEMEPLHEWYAARTLRGHVAVRAIELMREVKRLLRPLFRRDAQWGRSGTSETDASDQTNLTK